ncbi:putative protease Do-like 14 [Silene latifolia]|uniref:putative protease Do-like 14 n=1 Tax=Silene latifolia TaxID=37657 RepID=UPI003D775B51
MEMQVPPFNPWDSSEIRYTAPWEVYTESRDHFGRFDKFFEKNQGLDSTTKVVALKSSPFVVSLLSYTGIQRLFMCSGIILSSNGINGDFSSTILTSTSLLKCPTRKHAIANNIKVDVYLADGSLHEGQIVGHDFHYNLAVISIKPDSCLKIATIGNIDGSTVGSARGSTSFQLLPPRDSAVKLSPDLTVVALGRYHDHPYHIMAAPGALRFVDSDLDCGDLLVTDCQITKNGIGGPIITCSGCVLGISFYESEHTPFLPINIALKCLEHLQTNRKVPRPWLGVKLFDFDIASLSELDMLRQTFPTLVEGAVIRQVESESPASRAGLCIGDVVVQLDEKPVSKTLQFKGLLLDKGNKPLQVIVKRAGISVPLTLTVVPERPRKKNRWPIPSKRLIHTSA